MDTGRGQCELGKSLFSYSLGADQRSVSDHTTPAGEHS